MSENMGFLMRIKYVKRGRLAFLSHLETIRSMERIIRRAGLPYAVTEGFNPHMKVSFGPALPVGAASECEYLDLRLREYVKPQDSIWTPGPCSACSRAAWATSRRSSAATSTCAQTP